jgi:hypothetical protein
MMEWVQKLRFLWEEETAPAGGAPYRQAPSGVPRPLLKATRFAFIGVLATSLMGQIIGVRLIAPVDAKPAYEAQCIRQCQQTDKLCEAHCPKGKNGQSCKDTCQDHRKTCLASCDQENDGDNDQDDQHNGNQS